nr:TIGR02391 family protein [Streptomyces sp. NRRL S-31]
MRTNFHPGEYEIASFAAMKAVEVAVREASGLDNSLVGVPLMRAAFQPHKNAKPAGHWLTPKPKAASRKPPRLSSPEPWARTRTPPAIAP